MKIVHSVNTHIMLLPIIAGIDVLPGTLMMGGATAGTNNSMLIPNTAASNSKSIGVLSELFDFSVSGDAPMDGSSCWFAPEGENEANYPSRHVELVGSPTLNRLDQDLTDGADVDGATAATNVVITSLENNIDGGFLYVYAGTGIGTLEYITASAAGSCTTASDMGLDATSKVIKILPLFHTVMELSTPSATVDTKLITHTATGAAGTCRGMILERRIVRNGVDEMLDPHTHGGLTGLNSLDSFKIYSIVHMTDTAFQPVA